MLAEVWQVMISGVDMFEVHSTHASEAGAVAEAERVNRIESEDPCGLHIEAHVERREVLP